MASDGQEFWVFAYGSLMWQPGFAHLEAAPGTLHGFHRAMCILSTRYRGTPAAPGLVLGLDRGGSCRGVALRIDPPDREAVLSYLREREQVTTVYREHAAPVRLADGRRTVAHCFIARRDHPQYVGGMAAEQAARLIRQGRGGMGTSRDYLLNTVRHLRELGIRDGGLERLLALVDDPAAQRASAACRVGPAAAG